MALFFPSNGDMSIMGRTFLPTITRYPDFAQVPWTPARRSNATSHGAFLSGSSFFPLLLFQHYHPSDSIIDSQQSYIEYSPSAFQHLICYPSLELTPYLPTSTIPIFATIRSSAAYLLLSPNPRPHRYLFGIVVPKGRSRQGRR